MLEYDGFCVYNVSERNITFQEQFYVKRYNSIQLLLNRSLLREWFTMKLNIICKKYHSWINLNMCIVKQLAIILKVATWIDKKIFVLW